jgi:hypothetical protein
MIISVTENLNITFSELFVNNSNAVVTQAVYEYFLDRSKPFSYETENISLTEHASITIGFYVKNGSDNIDVAVIESPIPYVDISGGGRVYSKIDSTDFAVVDTVFNTRKINFDTQNITITETSNINCIQYRCSDPLNITLTEIGVSEINPAFPRIAVLATEIVHDQPNESYVRIGTIATEIGHEQPNESYSIITQVAYEYFIDKTRPFVYDNVGLSISEINYSSIRCNSSDILDISFTDSEEFKPQLFEVYPNSLPETQPNIILWCVGCNFMLTSQVIWNGIICNTTFVNSTLLYASIPKNLIVFGNSEVHILNP